MQDLGLGLGQRLALFLCENPGNAVSTFAQQLGCLLQDLRAIVHGDGAPLRKCARRAASTARCASTPVP